MEIYDENGILQQMAGAGGATTLDGLSDVVITAAAQGDILTRDGTDWDNVNIGTNEVVYRAGSGNVDGLAMAASTFLARLATGDVIAATVAQIKTLLALAVADITNAAHTALNNLASVAINTSLISDTDNTDNLGSSAIKWANFFGNAAVLEERAAPGTPAAGDVVLYAKADGLLYSKDDAGVETLVSAAAALYPLRATLWGDEAIVTAGTALTSGTTFSQLYNFYSVQSPAADGDSRTWSFVLKAGTYTFYFLGLSAASFGKVDWALDGTNIVTGQDWYSASVTYNVKKSQASVTVTGSGRHLLRATVNGKNASSSDYLIELTKVWVEPSADSTET